MDKYQQVSSVLGAPSHPDCLRCAEKGRFDACDKLSSDSVSPSQPFEETFEHELKIAVCSSHEADVGYPKGVVHEADDARAQYAQVKKSDRVHTYPSHHVNGI